MKKVFILFFSIILLTTMSCSNDEDIKQSWVFTITTVMSISPAMEGYPITNVTYIEQDNLTEAEASKVVEDTNLTQTMLMGEYTITTTITATKKVKQ